MSVQYFTNGNIMDVVNEKIIKDILIKIDELGADLSLKHKIKINIFKLNQSLQKIFWK